ncbi:ABC transporter permease [Xanthomarina sp. GH4-25]|uniref:ABC transporter permease n=1 Tax=Xanthomarina sp. GH4-25 TaxID=3349335 RepID=UPI000D678A17|nr:ABC transporter permease [Flavobacteriaceae bacterium LYZ1037]
MKDYFLLQFKILNRKTIEFGLPLLIGYTLIPFLFFFLSSYLFEKTEFASYIFLFIAVGFVSKLSDPKRNDFLKSIFNKKKFLMLRIIENIIYSIPFTLFLVYKGLYVLFSLLSLLFILIALIDLSVNFRFTIPTPFSKKPFEYVVGFRNTFFIFPIAYFLAYIAISVDNFNLGVFSMLLIGITCLSYYSKVENEYFVWNFSLTPKEFLFEKAKTCLIYFSLLTSPILIALSIFFFSEIDILIVFFLLCLVYLITIVFSKYSAFPNEMSISQVILIAGSLIFPPILLVVIPLFYSQSLKRLNSILND